MNSTITIKSILQYKTSTQEYNYGLLKLKCPSNGIMQDKINLVLSIDRSGSMMYVIKNVKQCLLNIVRYLRELVEDIEKLNQDLDILLTIILFDHETKYLCKKINMKSLISSHENYDKICQNINNIYARGMTNIEKVLNEVSTQGIQEYKNIHILMTDGSPTIGITDKEYLQTILNSQGNTNYEHNFLGFGIEHDAFMLKYFSKETNKGSYYFIDNIENAGMIYGEIIDKVIHKRFTNIHIASYNPYVVLYDTKTSSWNTEIKGIDMGNSDEYIYHFRIYNAKAHVIDKTICVSFNDPLRTIEDIRRNEMKDVLHFIDTTNSAVSKCDFTYIKIMNYRVKVIDVLNTYHTFNDEEYFLNINNNEEYELMKKTLNDLFDELESIKKEITYTDCETYIGLNECDLLFKRNYMVSFVQQLMDDLYVHKKFLTTGYMYCISRYISQVKQNTYNITNIETLLTNDYQTEYSQDTLEDDIINISGNNSVCDPNNVDTYKMSQDPLSVFATPQRVNIMRDVSLGKSTQYNSIE